MTVLDALHVRIDRCFLLPHAHQRRSSVGNGRARRAGGGGCAPQIAHLAIGPASAGVLAFHPDSYDRLNPAFPRRRQSRATQSPDDRIGTSRPHALGETHGAATPGTGRGLNRSRKEMPSTRHAAYARDRNRAQCANAQFARTYRADSRWTGGRQYDHNLNTNT